jgi:alpha/beta hydrolase family protein
MTSPPAIAAPRALLPAIVGRALGNGALQRAGSLLFAPLRALTPIAENTAGSAAAFDPHAPEARPVVLVHGFLGHPGQFRILARFLVGRGVRNFATFSYAPRLDHAALAPELGRMVTAVCESSGAAEVDVVGHSLGGLVARHVLESAAGARVRRLVTLGAPCLTDVLPDRESAIFGSADVLVQPPPHLRGRHTIIPRCGHLGLLYRLAPLNQAAAYLAEPTPTEVREARAA